MQYILLIHGNAHSHITADEWNAFFASARESGLFKGGSAIGARTVVGENQSVTSTEHIVGYMRFDSEDRQPVIDLLQQHPVVVHGGSVELCEMPKS